MCREFGRELTARELLHALRQLDADGDGRVSYDEFLAWWSHGLSVDVVMRNSPTQLRSATIARPTPAPPRPPPGRPTSTTSPRSAT